MLKKILQGSEIFQLSIFVKRSIQLYSYVIAPYTICKLNSHEIISDNLCRGKKVSFFKQYFIDILI